MRNIETIHLDWYGDFGITVYGSDCAWEAPMSLNNIPDPMEYLGEAKTFIHKEYAFKFSSHELNRIDLKAVLTLIEKVIVLEEWGYIPLCETLYPIRFSGKLKTFNIANIIINAILPIDSDGIKNYLNDAITKAIRTAKKKTERPVFFRRIPWELMRRRMPYVWYPDSGYKPFWDFEYMKMRKPTLDEIVNDMSLYTRFSTGFV